MQLEATSEWNARKVNIEDATCKQAKNKCKNIAEERCIFLAIYTQYGQYP